MGNIKERVHLYGIPSMVLITIAIVKLHLVGVFGTIYLYLDKAPMSMENTVIDWRKIFILLMLDMVVGVVYVWIKSINESIQEKDVNDGGSVKNIQGEEDNIDTHLLDEGLKRGFNYIWMSGVSNILITIIWSLVVVTLSILFKSVMIIHPNTAVTLSMVMGGLKLLITAIIKRGVLVYTVFSTYTEGNILRALKFSLVKVFRLIAIDIIYYMWVVIGMLLVGIGIFITVPQALHNQTERWSGLMRDFERENMY